MLSLLFEMLKTNLRAERDLLEPSRHTAKVKESFYWYSVLQTRKGTVL